ncbi:MAG: thiamine phosphate synthase [Alphaproteobacteria bacterium]|nr:thiamine phosphate synthase [Alphaproteobacteria bacterium]
MSAPRTRLYLLTPPKLPTGFAASLQQALDAGDVASVQLRLKGAADHEVLRAAEPLREICRGKNIAFLVNDRPDLALAADADGVHIGQQDASYQEARKTLGPDRIVGVTCHDSRDLGLTAAELGADYVAFGAFFPTATKAPPAIAPLELIAWWHELIEVPCVAIGGITVANCAPLVKAGADFLAVSSGVWDYPAGPAAAVRDFNAAIAAATP